jgi:nucleoside phosphorylase
MKIIILTPIQIEYNQVRSHLIPSSIVSIIHAGLIYEKGNFIGLHEDYEIIIKQTGSKNNDIALATEKAIQQFHPELVILVGIAGGIKDVEIGDVVVANKLYDYETGKETENGFVYRPELVYCSHDIFSIAENIGRNNNWKSRSKYANSSKVLYGAIASGNKVIGTTKSVVYDRIKTHLNDSLALEMEAIGFGKAMLFHSLIKFINIRGISDLLDNKSSTDKGGGQEVAIANATAFVFELLYQLDSSTLNIPKEIMEIRKFVTELFEATLPAIQKDLGVDPKLPISSNVATMLEKIKSTLPAAYKELSDDLNHVDNRADFRSELRRYLKKNDNIQKELSSLLEKERLEKPSGHVVSIVNSKNVIQGGKIQVGGDFHLGDKTETGQQINNNGNIEKQINIDKQNGDINIS